MEGAANSENGQPSPDAQNAQDAQNVQKELDEKTDLLKAHIAQATLAQAEENKLAAQSETPDTNNFTIGESEIKSEKSDSNNVTDDEINVFQGI